ncbi:hypothetical protein M409DRAFT_68463 [Zasmidium cellare ATCC 36951]|uniref:Uncharacterized protein n=1 Tax=Zasmidium cellare ATCC 36951 TaxID=1080233 RepID=A0A6A6C8S8_ZASCE|nr:uncharacterized protein M409DRAFT_68463 [Zasmidium cellare ATCC 36951]KAF2163554.1 hypothetical protein M409DRAFT_68463 [Zasmidium cellare ATCC 36951]
MNTWQPGVFRRFPWAGLGCLLGVFCSIVVDIVILAVSNGKPIASWRYPPSLYLSVAYTIGNILLAAAFSQGLTVFWWRKALREGTQLGDLHRYWEHGTSPVSAAFAGRNFNFISFAALFLALTPVNGPLLQRASSTTTDTRYFLSQDVNLSVPAARSLQDPTGHTSGRAYTVTMLETNYSSIVQDWNTGKAINITASGCSGDGLCSGSLTAAGLAVSCNTSTASFDLSGTSSDGSINSDSFDGLDIFSVGFTWTAYTPSNITVNLQYKPRKDCTEGRLEVANCTIGAATVQYPVVIDGNKSTIALKPQSTMDDDKVVSLVDYPSENVYGLPSPIGGYAYALSSRLDSSTHLRFAGAAGYDISTEGSIAAQFANMDDVTSYTSDMCSIKFSNPTDYLMQQARELMFRTALAQGNASTIQTIEDPSEVRTVTVYSSHYEYLGVSIGITFLAILLVLITFNGFWLLGRSVTMSPIETAKAFNAPLLAQEHPNAEVNELVKGAGMKPVRYGQVVDMSQSGGQTEFDKGADFGHGQMDTVELRQLQLALADPASVQPLGKRRK